MVTLTIDGKVAEVEEGTTILDAARTVGIEIPTLCYLRDLNEIGSCRVCVVEVEGIDQLVASCNNCVLDGMVVRTNSPKVREARKMNTELLLSMHDSSCTSCVRSGNCTLQGLANDLGIYYNDYGERSVRYLQWDKDLPLIRDNRKCIMCHRCIQVCDKVQASGVWDVTNRASHASINVSAGARLSDVDCTLCGQCITHCPTGALRERDDTEKVFAALGDPDVTVVAQIAPSVRTAWAESLGSEGGDVPLERLVGALHQMGFDYVLNTDFTADLTIMEEGSELLRHLERSQKGGYPLFTSCCPGWVRFVKAHYPQLVDDVSTSKSPQQMFGAMVKSYYAENLGLDPHKVFSVSIMPCVAKKAECSYENMNDACGDPDVDVVLTVREVVRMIRADHVNVDVVSDEPFDEPMGYGTGAGIIFGATGGVMEAALRTAHYLVLGKAPEDDMFESVRGLKGWKEATFDLGGTDVRVAVASGLANAKALCDAVVAGEVHYDFVEVMACPGGCVNGGGQPIHDGCELAGVRAEKLYGLDRVAKYRNSYENPQVKAAYENYLGEPLSERAEQLLHTDQHAWSMPGER